MADERVIQASERLQAAVASASRGLVEREALVEMVALAAVAGEHVLVIGAPGTAKSEAVRRFAAALSGKSYEYLLGRFTEPSEIFGPVDLKKLRDGLVETQTRDMLPEAEIAFLDEVFQGSTAILNTLLGILNDRVFRRGHTLVACPLRVCVGASNAIPTDETLAAFADRFLVRAFLDPLPDPRLEELLAAGWTLAHGAPTALASVADLDLLREAALALDLGLVRGEIARGIRLLRDAGIALSDRRIVKVQKLVAAAAVLSGRDAPTAADLWPLVLAVPGRQEQILAKDALRLFLEESESKALPRAAEEASAGPRARAARLVDVARELFDIPPPADGAPSLQRGWRLRLEAVAREIDAGFARDQLPPELASVRERIVEALGAAPAW
ncbi:MAG: AAA family ATPase [Acidobacteriota bacterium]